MKISILLFSAAITALSVSATTLPKVSYTLSKDYTVTINGTSNLHDWDEKVTTVTGSGSVEWKSDGSFDLSTADIKMEVHSIKSSEGSMMNNNTYKALKADNNPEITFTLSSPVVSVPAGAARAVTAKINLTIAGVTKAIEMQVTATSQANGSITFEGSKTIKMTDFGVTPPVALLGTLKTGNEITIHFKTVFVKNS